MGRVCLRETIGRIREELAATEGVLVAFSGGVDSAVVAKLAHEALGDRAVAVTVDSRTFTREELELAKKVARLIGIRHIVIKHDQLDEPGFRSNPPERCYVCRRSLARRLGVLARKLGIACIADGVNYSDLDEHRPGIRAATEAGFLHPLMKHRVTKVGVRRMARALGLPVHDRPSSACLSSRIPYWEEITPQKLRMIEEAERYIRGLGFRQVRVRVHELGARGCTRKRRAAPGGRDASRKVEDSSGALLLARVELDRAELPRLLKGNLWRRVDAKLSRLGFSFITLDLRGYRSGSLDMLIV
ncbi:MAG: ATP-dependent sacrificial sulfur transferase LarE [Thermoplasmata archaeon]